MSFQRNYLIYRVLKPVVDSNAWNKSTRNHFIASMHEKDSHILKKFERWLYWRRNGSDVFCELVLNKEYGGLRPDLVIVTDKDVFIEEIVNSEKKESIEIKNNKYPFKIFVIDCQTPLVF